MVIQLRWRLLANYVKIDLRVPFSQEASRDDVGDAKNDRKGQGAEMQEPNGDDLCRIMEYFHRVVRRESLKSIENKDTGRLERAGTLFTVLKHLRDPVAAQIGESRSRIPEYADKTIQDWLSAERENWAVSAASQYFMKNCACWATYHGDHNKKEKDALEKLKSNCRSRHSDDGLCEWQTKQSEAGKSAETSLFRWRALIGGCPPDYMNGFKESMLRAIMTTPDGYNIAFRTKVGADSVLYFEENGPASEALVAKGLRGDNAVEGSDGISSEIEVMGSQDFEAYRIFCEHHRLYVVGDSYDPETKNPLGSLSLTATIVTPAGTQHYCRCTKNCRWKVVRESFERQPMPESFSLVPICVCADRENCRGNIWPRIEGHLSRCPHCLDRGVSLQEASRASTRREFQRLEVVNSASEETVANGTD